MGVTACVLGDMGCLRFRLRVWDTLKEEDEGWSEKKKNGGTRFSKTRVLRGNSFPHRMPLLGSQVLKTQDASFPVCFATWQLMTFLEN